MASENLESFKPKDRAMIYGREVVVECLVHESGSTLYGVRFLRSSCGNTDGVYQGVRYFTCGKRKGRFVPQNLLQPYDVKKSLAILLGAFWRCYVARKEFSRSMMITVWNELESLCENDVLKKNRDVGAPLEQKIIEQLEDETTPSDSSSTSCIPEEKVIELSATKYIPAPRRSIQRNSIDASTVLTEQIDPNYKGPIISLPMTRKCALELLEFFRKNPNVPLPRRYAFDILLKMEQLLEETVKGCVIHFELPRRPECKLILVGDVHGQLNDVLWLFFKFGPPSPTNIYLFNGDISDRGMYATEIFLILFCFKLSHPNSVLINRGNHESRDMNQVYGFSDEVRLKYGGLCYHKFQDIFQLLPLCYVIESRVAVFHGGLTRADHVTLQRINEIDRRRPCPSTIETLDDALMFDILWSDPQKEKGRGISSRGSDCITFGPDITDEFLQLNDLDVIIRSHQVPSNMHGFEPLHEGQCVTLFSASNYCGTTGNYGGVIIFDATMAFEVQEYMAPSLKEIDDLVKETEMATAKVLSKSKGINEAERLAVKSHSRSSNLFAEAAVLNSIGRFVCERKQELWWFLFNQDCKKEGWVRPLEFRDACTSVFGEGFPWMFLMKKLDVIDRSKGDERVYYNDYLARFRVEFQPKTETFQHTSWRKDCIASVFESILAADLSLKETMMVFDRNCDGTVSFREFSDFFMAMDTGLSDPQVKILMRLITANQMEQSSGKIDAAEFLGRFKVVYEYGRNQKDSRVINKKDAWIVTALEMIGKFILADRVEAARRHYDSQKTYEEKVSQSRRRSSAVRSVALFQKFKEFNIRGDGFLSYEDFIANIKRLPLDQLTERLGFPLQESHLYEIARFVDITGSKKINYFEFLSAFHGVESSSKTNVAEELWGHICTTLFQYKGSIRRALQQFDPDLTGKVAIEDFRSALVALNNMLSRTEAPLTADQIETLVTCVDCDYEEMLDYEQFLNSFVVIMSPKAVSNVAKS